MSRKEEKLAQIIAAATDEFLSKGIDAASMHNIAEQAEVSKRTLYKYFSTKEELYSALIDEILNRMESMYQFDYSPSTPVKEQIEKVVASKIELTLADSFLKISKIIIGELLKSRRPTEKQMARLNKSESLFVKWIEQIQKNGEITTSLSAEEIASQFHSILKGQIYWPILLGLQDKSELDLKAVKKTTVDFFLNSFCE